MTPFPLVLTDSADAMTVEAERAVIWSFRQWIIGHVRGRVCHWQLAWQRLADLLGQDDGTHAVVALEALVRAVCRNARRTVAYHEPPCPCLGDDERDVLAIIAACQRAAWRSAAATAERLIEPDGVGDVIAAAARLARLLADHGQHLRVAEERTYQPTASDAPRVARPTLH